MEEYDARYAVSIYSCKLAALPFRHFYEPDAEKDEQKKRRRTAEKAPFFAYGTVDEVRVLLGYEVVLGLGVPLPLLCRPLRAGQMAGK